ncbi:unnamed protein product [Trichogramma brassicae]|uniref:Uncharacterized protein n=1 Tax=Trichogramma brassicae TaxID=86971 RepID=A0A6H5HYQ5_9HYME|nr:unnamed protein product [Trichogramma brassicae]
MVTETILGPQSPSKYCTNPRSSIYRLSSRSRESAADNGSARRKHPAPSPGKILSLVSRTDDRCNPLPATIINFEAMESTTSYTPCVCVYFHAPSERLFKLSIWSAFCNWGCHYDDVLICMKSVDRKLHYMYRKKYVYSSSTTTCCRSTAWTIEANCSLILHVVRELIALTDADRRRRSSSCLLDRESRVRTFPGKSLSVQCSRSTSSNSTSSKVHLTTIAVAPLVVAAVQAVLCAHEAKCIIYRSSKRETYHAYKGDEEAASTKIGCESLVVVACRCSALDELTKFSLCGKLSQYHALLLKQAQMVKFLQEEIDLKIHELRFEDGRSALHYLLNENKFSPRYDVGGKMAKQVVDYFLEDSEENHQDFHGYTYFHAACMTGNVAKVNQFLEQGVDVNFSTYSCSPLHIAAQYRQTDVVKILLEKGADPNCRERINNRSTPLHALSWQRWCMCECDHYCHSCDDNKPAYEVVALLIERGADIEARDSHGDTPLQAAVSCFDLELTRALLKLGASLSGLNEDSMFGRHFETRELKYRPLTMNMIEVVEVLQSAGYKMDFATRLEMIRCWMRVRGNGADHLLPSYVSESNRHLILHFFINFYMERKPYDYLRSEMRRMKKGKYFGLGKIPQGFNDEITLETTQLKSIMLNEKVSLHEICQMSYDKGYSILKKIKNFQLPQQLNDLTLSQLLVKRHLADTLIRSHLELAVADLFMNDKCNLNLPYVVCRQIAENLSHEDLLRLCEKTNEEEDAVQPSPKRRRLR